MQQPALASRSHARRARARTSANEHADATIAGESPIEAFAAIEA
jgi:hypothetical protein